MKALKVTQAGELTAQEVDVPKLRPGFCLVLVKAVALNPTDFKHLYGIECTGCTLGCDYAGIVEEVGADSILKRGDRVAGFVHGANMAHPEDGTFAEYVLAREGLQYIIPEGMRFEEAASFGVAIATIGMALCQSLRLPLPMETCSQNLWVLIYGGSTATGTVAIQTAKLAGLNVITTCSPANSGLVKSLGASAAFDYRDAGCGEAIRAQTQGSLHHAFDCISDDASAAVCAKALAQSTPSQPSRYCSTLPVQCPREDVVSNFVLAYTAPGEAFHKFIDFPANREDYEFAKKFFRVFQQLLNEGKVVHHPVEVREGGLEGIPAGLDDLKEGTVSAKKLVYVIS
ncbi:oxidoreductase-like protein [Ampelomyces quisqualis]|uniref:Oxidoreductase-like protein n=1 Tax=Ampelomyces quisqualis TaxID=50730 RepID=A0A6A5QNK1_AMPQU|nr:oxidoreductase-like protein [Ampelomyces quisqualis]